MSRLVWKHRYIMNQSRLYQSVRQQLSFPPDGRCDIKDIWPKIKISFLTLQFTKRNPYKLIILRAIQVKFIQNSEKWWANASNHFPFFWGYIFSFISLERSLPDTRYAAKHKTGRWHQPSRLNKNKIPSKVSVKNEFQNFCWIKAK